MKLRHLMTAALGAVLLSCQGPAAVLAQDGAAGGGAGSFSGPADPEREAVAHVRRRPAEQALDEALRLAVRS